MITRSLSPVPPPTRRGERWVPPSRVGKGARGLGERRGSVVGPTHKGAFPGCGRARLPGPPKLIALRVGGQVLRSSCGASEGGNKRRGQHAVEQLLVVYYLPEQSEQRVERELQRRQREREQ